MNQRYEREIDELLHRIEGRMRREPLSRRLSRRFGPYSHGMRRALAAFLRRPPAEIFMITGLILVVLSYALSIFGSGKWASYASVLSLVFFLFGIALSLAGRHSPRYRKKWRGREVDYESHGPPAWLVGLRNWLRRRRR